MLSLREIEAIADRLKRSSGERRKLELFSFAVELGFDPNRRTLRQIYETLSDDEKLFVDAMNDNYESDEICEYIKCSPSEILEQINSQLRISPVDPADLTEFITRVREWEQLPAGSRKDQAAGYAIGLLNERGIAYTPGYSRRTPKKSK